MLAVKVDNAHRIRLVKLAPGDYWEPEFRSPDELLLKRIQPPKRLKRPKSREEVVQALKRSQLKFTVSWDELKEETR